jgi:hypothetical protein
MYNHFHVNNNHQPQPRETSLRRTKENSVERRLGSIRRLDLHVHHHVQVAGKDRSPRRTRPSLDRTLSQAPGTDPPHETHLHAAQITERCGRFR